MPLKTKVTRRGNMNAIARRNLADAEAAITTGMREGTEELKAVLRAQVTRSGLGPRLARTWRALHFPRSGRSLKAAGFVFSKAPKLARAFDEGARIRSKSGLFLAIPTEAAPKRGIGGKRLTPSNFPEQALGKLRFVFRRGRPSLLVVDGLVARTGKRGGFRRATVRKATKRRGAFVSTRGLATVAMFTLVPQVRLKKRLDIEGAAGRALRRLPARILANWPRRQIARGAP